jgi:hypothetical protein
MSDRQYTRLPALCHRPNRASGLKKKDRPNGDPSPHPYSFPTRFAVRGLSLSRNWLLPAHSDATPSRNANSAAWVRLSRVSLDRMLLTCVRAVASLMES